MKYRIVSTGRSDLTEDAVVRMIEEGWEPLGGVAATGDRMTTKYMQAMINKDDSQELSKRNQSVAYGVVIAHARETLSTTAAALAAAVSLLERGGRMAAPSNRMFKQMIVDYKEALDDARELLNSDLLSDAIHQNKPGDDDDVHGLVQP